MRERSYSVVECSTGDWGAAGSGLISVLVQLRKTRPYTTERLLMDRKQMKILQSKKGLRKSALHYDMLHTLWLFRLGFLLGCCFCWSSTIAAVSNTRFTPTRFIEEHSTYSLAPKDFAILIPCSIETGRSSFSVNLAIVCVSSLRSVFIPTSKKGLFGVRIRISVSHFCFTFSSVSGSVTLKQTRKMSVFSQNVSRNRRYSSWSGRSINEQPRHEISKMVVCATSQGSDQPAHTRSLIRAFATRLNIFWLLSYWQNSIWSFFLMA